jgi:hypothetical protein
MVTIMEEGAKEAEGVDGVEGVEGAEGFYARLEGWAEFEAPDRVAQPAVDLPDAG